ncbi:argininosuccinate lyase [Actinokineospora globicatena]|uniref:argininosuccinate lyase n=1 Tax=Actinokineospora globicatena TaxID=103729 RepID=A0A9W6QIZ1_9PSEU|nr:lyase family protein [Actinokineospora globicatena]GLW90342.1 argininosuccinate lyase [Actinokineospora globicatena]
MTATSGTRLTGRIAERPSAVIDEEVLAPQFRYEVAALLPHYVSVEKVLALEYRRMGLLTDDQAREVGGLLSGARRELAAADPSVNMSDIAFALEQHVRWGLSAPLAAWHVDRSRNDFQACAQVMHLRAGLLEVLDLLLGLWPLADELATAHLSAPMPGHTHFQAAQVITPAFWLTAFTDQVLRGAGRLLSTYDLIDSCPLGAGAMAGQELDWDRERMADLLGFARPTPHALAAVASRGHVLEVTAELSLLGAAISRFGTDLLMWGGSDCQFLDLPDELSGISSAMPQKKNFPVLERVRGKSGHLAAFHTDALLGQRNTPFTNLVEVSKEAGAHAHLALREARSMLRLLTVVLGGLSFRTDRMREACEREYFGGFTLANSLTTRFAVPWRDSQVVVGAFITASLRRRTEPGAADPALLESIAADHGYPITGTEDAVRAAFDVDHALVVKTSAGSTHPDRVRDLLAAQRAEHDRRTRELDERRERATAVDDRVDALLAEGTDA